MTWPRRFKSAWRRLALHIIAWQSFSPNSTRFSAICPKTAASPRSTSGWAATAPSTSAPRPGAWTVFRARSATSLSGTTMAAPPTKPPVKTQRFCLFLAPFSRTPSAAAPTSSSSQTRIPQQTARRSRPTPAQRPAAFSKASRTTICGSASSRSTRCSRAGGRWAGPPAPQSPSQAPASRSGTTLPSTHALLQKSSLHHHPSNTPRSYPAAQGPYYCAVGADVSFGREVVEAHLKLCLASGVTISGVNAEVMPGQWEYQVGPCVGISAADHMLISRYLMLRVGEVFDVVIRCCTFAPVCAALRAAAKRSSFTRSCAFHFANSVCSFDPKPVPGNWNGAGCHTNVSTKSTRASGGYAVIVQHMEKLREQHVAHIKAYGEGNERRLTGHHETSSMDTFSYGVANRGCRCRPPPPAPRILRHASAASASPAPRTRSSAGTTKTGGQRRTWTRTVSRPSSPPPLFCSRCKSTILNVSPPRRHCLFVYTREFVCVNAFRLPPASSSAAALQ